MTQPPIDVYPGQPWEGAPAPPPDQHVQLWVNGHEVSCDTLAVLSIRGGRGDFLSDADSATVSFTLQWPANTAPPAFGDQVDIFGWLVGTTPAQTGAALFTGHITDIALEDDWWHIVAADPLRRLQGIKVGDTPWPEESVQDRIERVWDALRAAAPAPDRVWMGSGHDLVASVSHIWGTGGVWGVGASSTVVRRDVDSQPGLDLTRDYLRTFLGDLYYRPDTAWPSPQDPKAWKPKVTVRNQFSVGALIPVDGYPWVFLSDCMVVADPPPRYFQNLGIMINQWKATYKIVDPAKPAEAPKDGEAIATADAGIIERFGPRQSSVNTELKWVVLPAGTPGSGVVINPAQSLADLLLTRTKVPDWSVDQVVIVFDPATQQSVNDADRQSSWAVVAHGAAQIGRGMNAKGLRGATSTTNHLYTSWVVEQTQIDWTVGGWTVTVTASPESVYNGTVENQVLLLVSAPTRIPQRGGTVEVQVIRPYDRRPVTGGTLQITGGTAVPNTGGPVVLPIPDQPDSSIGHNVDLPVTFTPPAGSKDQPTTVTVSPLVFRTSTYLLVRDEPCHPTYDLLADPVISTKAANHQCGHRDYQDVLGTMHPHPATP
jgi:hypothetical protein